MTDLDRKLKAAKRYLRERGIAATAADSKLRYRNAAGQVTPQPEWIRKDAPLVVVLTERVKT